MHAISPVPPMNKWAEARPSQKAGSAAILCLVLPLSLVLTAAVNRQAGLLLASQLPALSWLAAAAIPSFVVIAMLFAMLGDKSLLVWPDRARTMQHNVVGLSFAWLLCWLVGCVVAAFIAGQWIVYARGLPLIAAFLLFGPLGEELLFRGLIFDQVSKVWASPSPRIPILLSTAAFSLHHLWIDAAPDGLALAQILFTIPMGIILALLRIRTGSLWPPLGLHIATNLPAVIPIG